MQCWIEGSGIVRAAALIVLVAVLPARADDDAFTVGGVHEDVTAANASAARDQSAGAEGQHKAFDTLMGRIAAGKAPHVNTSQITDLVIGFEVANERTSPVRYVADYTFHFNPNGIRRLLSDNGTARAAYVAPVKPVVVLPVYSEGGRAVLWDDPNPWRDAWAQHRVPAAGRVSDRDSGWRSRRCLHDRRAEGGGGRSGGVEGDRGPLSERRRAGGAGQVPRRAAPLRRDRFALFAEQSGDAVIDAHHCRGEARRGGCGADGARRCRRRRAGGPIVEVGEYARCQRRRHDRRGA